MIYQLLSIINIYIYGYIILYHPVSSYSLMIDIWMWIIFNGFDDYGWKDNDLMVWYIWLSYSDLTVTSVASLEWWLVRIVFPSASLISGDWILIIDPDISHIDRSWYIGVWLYNYCKCIDIFLWISRYVWMIVKGYLWVLYS